MGLFEQETRIPQGLDSLSRIHSLTRLLDQNPDYVVFRNQFTLSVQGLSKVEKKKKYNGLKQEIKDGILELLVVPFIQEYHQQRVANGSTDTMLYTLDDAREQIGDISREKFIMRKTAGFGYTEKSMEPTAIEITPDRTIARIYIAQKDRRVAGVIHNWEKFFQSVSENPGRYTPGVEYVHIVAAGVKEKIENELIGQYGKIPDGLIVEEAPVSIAELDSLSDLLMTSVGFSALTQEKIKPINPPEVFLRPEVAVPEGPETAIFLAQYWNLHRNDKPFENNANAVLKYLSSNQELQRRVKNMIVRNNSFARAQSLVTADVHEALVYFWLRQQCDTSSVVLTADETRNIVLSLYPKELLEVELETGEEYIPGVSIPDFFIVSLDSYHTPKIVQTIETTTNPGYSFKKVEGKIFGRALDVHKNPHLYLPGLVSIAFLVPNDPPTVRSNIRSHITAIASRGRSNGVSDPDKYFITQESLSPFHNGKTTKDIEVKIIDVPLSNIDTRALGDKVFRLAQNQL